MQAIAVHSGVETRNTSASAEPSQIPDRAGDAHRLANERTVAPAQTESDGLIFSWRPSWAWLVERGGTHSCLTSEAIGQYQLASISLQKLCFRKL